MQYRNGKVLVPIITCQTKQVDIKYFGFLLQLTTSQGYLETCAAVGLVLFAHQMARISPRKMVYADAMELALYNGVQVGISLDGNRFFYDNPLAVNDKYLERKEWFDVACCPANVRLVFCTYRFCVLTSSFQAARLLSSAGGLIYGMGADDTVFVHLYISSKTKLTLASGTTLKLEQDSLGPWQGGASFTLTPISGHAALTSSQVALCFRIPPGCEDSFSVCIILQNHRDRPPFAYLSAGIVNLRKRLFQRFLSPPSNCHGHHSARLLERAARQSTHKDQGFFHLHRATNPPSPTGSRQPPLRRHLARTVRLLC